MKVKAAHWGRRTVVAIALAGFAVAGFAHIFQPGPGWVGGLSQPASVQGFAHTHQTGPEWIGG